MDNRPIGVFDSGIGGVTFYITGGIKEFQAQLEKFGMANIHIHPVEITKLNQTPKVHKAEIYKSQKEK